MARFQIYFGSPVEDAAPAEPLARPIQRTLVAVSRQTQRPRRKAHVLPPIPAVIGAGISFGGPGVRLVDPDRPYRRRRQTFVLPPYPVVVSPVPLSFGPKTKLVRIRPQRTTVRRSAIVVALPPAIEIYGPKVSLTRKKPQPTTTALRPPIVVRLAVEVYGPETNLAPQRRGKTKSILRNYIAVEEEVKAYYGPQTTLVRIRPVSVKSDLYAPTLILSGEAEPRVGGIGIQLVRIRPPRKTASLGRPTVVNQPQGPQGGILVSLAPSRRKITKPKLRPPVSVRPPVVTEAIGQLATNLVRIRPQPTATKYDLGGPVVIGSGEAAEQRGGIRVTLARIRPFPTTALLRAPVVSAVEVVEIYGPEVSLARIRPPAVRSDLGAPIVVFVLRALGGIGTKLVRTRPFPTTTLLRAPTVTTAAVTEIYGPETTLVRIRPVAIKSDLYAPAVIFPPLQGGGIGVSLAYSRRGTPKSELRTPAVVGAEVVVVYYGPQTSLVRIRPRRTLTKLRTPRVVNLAVEIYGPETQLIRKRPRPTITELRAPRAVRLAAEIYGPEVALAYSRRGKAKSKLSAPAVVTAAFIASPIVTSLAYSLRGTPGPIRIVPEVVKPAVTHRPVKTAQVDNRRTRRQTVSFYRGPVVVEAPVVEPEAPTPVPQQGGGSGRLGTVVGGPKRTHEEVVNRSITLHRVIVVSHTIRFRGRVSSFSTTLHGLIEEIYIDPEYTKRRQKADEEFIKKLIEDDLL